MEADDTSKAAMAEAAEFFYDVCELYEDEDLDPDDHLEVIVRAFTSSHCDDFAAVIAEEYGCDVVGAVWTIPDYGFGHHTLLRHADGRLFDVTGWTDEKALRKRYGIPRDVAITFSDGHGSSPLVNPWDLDWQLLKSLAEHLPYAPFNDGSLRPKAQHGL